MRIFSGAPTRSAAASQGTTVRPSPLSGLPELARSLRNEESAGGGAAGQEAPGPWTGLAPLDGGGERTELTIDGLKLLFNYAPYAYYLIDLKGHFVDGNMEAERLLGYRRSELVGKSLFKANLLFSKAQLTRAAALLAQNLRGRATGPDEFMLTGKDGRRVLVEIRTFPLRIEDRTLIVGIANDITKRRKSEEALSAWERRFELVISASGQVVYDYDLATGAIEWNGGVEQVLGYSLADMGGITEWSGRIHPEDRDEALRLLGAAEKAGTVYEVEYRFRHGLGGYRWIHDSGSFLLDEAKGPRRMIGMMQDITERKQADLLQTALYRIAEAADKSASLDELYASVHRIVGTVMPAGNFYIALYDRERDLISFPYFVDEEDEPPEPCHPGKGLTEYVIRTGRSLLCDEAVDRELRGRGEVEVVGAPSAIWLGVPLIVDGKTFGVMVVQHYSDPGAYDRRELRMLEYVSSQVARSIDRKRAEAAVRSSETTLRVFIDALPGPAMLLDREETILEANEAMARSLGRGRTEIVGEKAFSFLPPETARHRRGRFIRCLEIEKPVVFEDERGGRSFLNYLYPVLNQNKIVTRVALYALDMTARKEAERALLREKSFGDTIIESLPGAFYCCEVHEGQMTFVRWNASQEKLLGYSGDEMGRLEPLEAIAPEDRGLARERIGEALASGAGRAELSLLTKDGRRVPVIMTGARVDVEGRTYVLGTAIDIARSKEVEKALHDSEELHRRLVAAIPDLIIRTDLAGTIVFANEIAVRMSGLGPAQNLIGRNVFDFVAPQDREKAVQASRLMIEKKIGPQEIALLFADKGQVQFEIDGAILRNPDGSPYGVVYLCRDITERKRAETSLREGLAKLRSTLKASIDSLASAIEMRDPYTAGHQERVTRLARAIAVEMGLGEDRVQAIEIAGVIHDLGKLYVPAEILSKPTKLTDLEYAMIKMHAQAGYTILSKIDFPWPIAQIVHQHHELVNGSGYPRGLTGKEILLEARILCVADVVEAMSSHRPYRPSLGISTALEEVAQKRGILYDREVVDACLRLFREKGFKFD
jgi:PAS domain S-box-containing protein